MPRIPTEPNDPYRPPSDYDVERDARLERDAQIDPELAEGRASTGKMAMYALAAALVLGALFYGLNNSRVHEASTSPPAQNAQTQSANPNSKPGMTTGSATNRPTPPQSSATGSEIDRAGNPNAGQNNDNR
ncbi:MAG TPA: hypothetical protein VKY22_18010 [Bradyrhizobium sp.]|nr:hypothetical protein [Bradyrhizobium sp.]